jgi:hypothetical protein
VNVDRELKSSHACALGVGVVVRGVWGGVLLTQHLYQQLQVGLGVKGRVKTQHRPVLGGGGATAASWQKKG